jgi:hypothetical protein
VWLAQIMKPAFGAFAAIRIFYQEEHYGAPLNMLVADGVCFSATSIAIVLPIAWIIVTFA